MKSLYHIIHAVSPSNFGGETKNQDRIRYDSETTTACVCDGTTTSPYSERAAKIVTQSSLILLDNPEQNLKTVSDYLMACRDRVIKNGVRADSSVPISIRNIVQDAARASLKQSFQTTLAAVRLESQESNIVARILCCGDSGFFAVSAIGELLFTNLKDVANTMNHNGLHTHNAIPYYPGSELLIKVIGTLSEFPELLKIHGQRSPNKWYVCRAVCNCGNEQALDEIKDHAGLYLKPGELLLIPKYLVAAPKDPEYKEFRRVHYSQFIQRAVLSGMIYSDIHFDFQGNTTAVLPDHFYTNQWTFIEERFPLDTHFFLCSDGFYRAFPDPAQMWSWLKTNENALKNKISKQKLLQTLHRQLSQTCGDDDISFIWMIPNKGETYVLGSNE